MGVLARLPLLGRFFGGGPAGLPPASDRAHLLVHVDPENGTFDFEIRSPFTVAEAEPVLEAAFGQVRELTESHRQQRVADFIRDAQKEIGVLDKLRRRGTRWEAEARNVVPLEMFTASAGRGLVEVTIDGELGFVSILVSIDAGPKSTPALAKEALLKAENLVRDRWAECLRGALEEMPDDDDVQLALPAPEPEMAVASQEPERDWEYEPDPPASEEDEDQEDEEQEDEDQEDEDQEDEDQQNEDQEEDEGDDGEPDEKEEDGSKTSSDESSTKLDSSQTDLIEG